MLPREHPGHGKHSLLMTRGNSMHGQLQMVNNEIILVILFVAEDGEAV